MWRYEGKIKIYNLDGRRFELLQKTLKKSRIRFLSEAIRTTDREAVSLIVTPLCPETAVTPDRVLDFCEQLPRRIDAVCNTEAEFRFVNEREMVGGYLTTTRDGVSSLVYDSSPVEEEDLAI